MTRAQSTRRNALLALSLLALCAGPALAAAKAKPKPASSKRPPELQSSPSDRALYQDARDSLALLKHSRKLMAQRAEWDKLLAKFRRVVARYPQSGYADDALLAIGDACREMAERFKAKQYRDDAVAAYKQLADEYPRSRLGEPALYAVFEIASESPERKRVGDAARGYLEAYPDGKNAAAVKAAIKKRAPEPLPTPPLPTPPPPGVGQVFSLRSWSGEASTRVVIDVEKELPFKWDRLSGPERLFVDLQGARLHPTLKDRHFPVGDGLLEQVRIGQNQDSVVRVVLDFKSVREHQVFYLRDPMRLVIDVRGAKLPSAEPERVQIAERDPLPELPVDEIGSSRPVVGMAPAEPRTSPATARRPPGKITVEGPPLTAERRASGTTPAPAPPAANRSGQYSLARQLGLSARRIVVDAGHGGHDPGTIGRRGLQEKDLVLDVALRLEGLLKGLGAEVVMTRDRDVFIPLEERTAIANAKGADLFLSIHANSSPNPRARGIETYFLNFAKDSHAEAVAARENAISQATLKDLQNLVKAIALNSKIDESREFASEVQEALIANLQAQDASLPDRGVHTAPFYVLIGANMPSILAEISFVSNPDDEKQLKRGEQRELIAQSLFKGVTRYLEALNRTAARPLTPAGPRTRVAGKGAR